MQLSELVATWLLHKRAEGLSARSLAFYADHAGRMVAAVGDGEATTVRAVQLAAWLVAERDRGLSDASVDCCWRTAAAFWSWAVAQEYVATSPMGEGRRRKVPRPRRRQPAIHAVKFDEYRRVVDAIDLASWTDYRDWCVVGVLFWCGLRLGELARLAVADVDVGRGLLIVQSGKGGKARVVPVVEDLAAGLATYVTMRPAGYDALWLELDKDNRRVKGQMMEPGLRQLLSRRTAVVGLARLHPHTWRHGFAVAMLNAGAEMSSVGAMMGHSSTRVTEAVYAHWQTTGIQRQYRAAAALIQESG